jgi:hypothetical protein
MQPNQYIRPPSGIAIRLGSMLSYQGKVLCTYGYGYETTIHSRC